MTASRVLVAVLVILVVLFVVGIGGGLAGGCEGCRPSKDTRATWQRKLLRPEPVRAGELRGCASALGTFELGAPCDLEIAKSPAYRKLTVSAARGTELEVSFFTDADGRPIQQHAHVTAGDPAEISIGRNRYTVHLQCASRSPCKATLQ